MREKTSARARKGPGLSFSSVIGMISNWLELAFFLHGRDLFVCLSVCLSMSPVLLLFSLESIPLRDVVCGFCFDVGNTSSSPSSLAEVLGSVGFGVPNHKRCYYIYYIVGTNETEHRRT